MRPECCGLVLRYSVKVAGSLLLLSGAWTVAPAQNGDAQYDTALYNAMQWRNIGPHRGGRSVAVSGVTSDAFTYYFGGTGGGVWKTEDAGETWTNISDGYLKTGSVGAIAVSESDANVIYVGMGEHAVRGVTTSHGDGVYKSTDAGKTWTHMGLAATRVIARIRVHPSNPDLVYVAAQGATHGPTPERGIYRSRDGGATWQQVLFVSKSAGASELSMDPTNPRMLYAGFWDHQRYPWTVVSGGPGSGIYKSSDGGDTWEELSSGLPELMGKTAVDVSPANPDRVWALIEAEGDEGGLYLSDDAGASWTQVNSERVTRARAWYYIEVYADPQDEETVYIMNAPFLKSVDGGRTFKQIRVPHGDQHDLWINPTNNRNMINANDGGANISFNGGQSWSTQQNQPTAQFYRVITDNRFPYHVYGGQQDNSTVAIASRTSDAGIDWKDWYRVGGCESAHVAFDPDDPVLVYAGCYQGQISRYDVRTKIARNIMAYPYLGLGMAPEDMRYRFNWNAPIVASPHDRSVIYHAGNVLLKTEDGGVGWVEVSPDLTRNEKAKQGPGGSPITNEAAGGENYNTIMYVIESPHEVGTIWVGTDDGLVHLTRDGGANWENVTPRDVGEAMINSIEVSPHDAASAYIVVTRYKFNDLTPHIYKTNDYGRSWRRIVRGIDEEAWVRAVREDPVRRGLLYAGTETGVYVSFDDGQRWQTLQLNLPVVPVTDLKIQGNDLVASTQGRAFWILDDLSPLRQIDDEVARAVAHAFAPGRAYLFGGSGDSLPRMGANPPEGAIVQYYLAAAPDSEVTLEILDGAGAVIRTYSSVKQEGSDEKPIPAKAGQNRAVWDLRHEPLPKAEGLFVFGSLQGRRVMPGTYQVRLTASEHTQTQSFEVEGDPRLRLSPTDYMAVDEFLVAIREQLSEMHEGVNRIRDVKEQIEGFLERIEGRPEAEELDEAGDALMERLTGLEEMLVQPKQKTFQDVVNFPSQLNAQFLYIRVAADAAGPPLTEGVKTRLADLSEQWSEQKALMESLLEQELANWNALVQQKGVPAVIVSTEP